MGTSPYQRIPHHEIFRCPSALDHLDLSGSHQDDHRTWFSRCPTDDLRPFKDTEPRSEDRTSGHFTANDVMRMRAYASGTSPVVITIAL